MLSNLTAIQSYFYPVSKKSNFNINIIPMRFPLLYSTIISRWLFIRDHSRNQTKGGSKRNSPQCSTMTCFFLTILLSLCSQRVQKPLQRTLPIVFYTKLCSNHRVRVGFEVVHSHVFEKKKLFCSDQMVVSPGKVCLKSAGLYKLIQTIFPVPTIF